MSDEWRECAHVGDGRAEGSEGAGGSCVGEGWAAGAHGPCPACRVSALHLHTLTLHLRFALLTLCLSSQLAAGRLGGRALVCWRLWLLGSRRPCPWRLRCRVVVVVLSSCRPLIVRGSSIDLQKAVWARLASGRGDGTSASRLGRPHNVQLIQRTARVQASYKASRIYRHGGTGPRHRHNRMNLNEEDTGRRPYAVRGTRRRPYRTRHVRVRSLKPQSTRKSISQNSIFGIHSIGYNIACFYSQGQERFRGPSCDCNLLPFGRATLPASLRLLRVK
jgi:hypothetical protein